MKMKLEDEKCRLERILSLVRSRSLVIFVVFFLVYAVMSGLRFYGYGDEAYLTALTLLTKRSFFIGAYTVGGYGRAGLVDSILALPFALLELLGISRGITGSMYYVTFSALGNAVFFRFASRLYGSISVGTMLTLLLGFGTQVWVYSKIGMEPVMTFFMILAAYLFYEYSRSHRGVLVFLGGLAAGMILLSKMYGVIAAAPLLLYLLLKSDGTKLRNTLLAAFPIIAMGGLSLLFNYARYGDIFMTPYNLEVQFGAMIPFYVNLFAFFLSPGQSIFIYSPPTLLGVAAFPFFLKRYKAEFVLCASMLVVFLGVFTPLWYGAGEEVWGPRYLTELIPFLILPIGVLFCNILGQRSSRTIFSAVLCIGVLVQVMGLSFAYESYVYFMRSLGLYGMDLSTFVPNLSHLAFNATLFASAVSRFLTGQSLSFEFVLRTDTAHMPTIVSRTLAGVDEFDLPVLSRIPYASLLILLVCLILIAIAARQCNRNHLSGQDLANASEDERRI